MNTEREKIKEIEQKNLPKDKISDKDMKKTIDIFSGIDWKKAFNEAEANGSWARHFP